MRKREMWLLGLAGALLWAGCAKDKPPAITGLKAFPDTVGAGTPVALQLTVNDPAHRALKYKWTAKDGTLSGSQDSTATWTPPDNPGSYKVSVVVTDPKGGTATKMVQVKVLAEGDLYSGSLNAQNQTGKKQHGKSGTPGQQPKKPPRTMRAPKTTN